MITHKGDYAFFLVPGKEVTVTNGKASVSFAVDTVLTKHDLDLWALGFVAGKSKGWAATI